MGLVQPSGVRRRGVKGISRDVGMRHSYGVGMEGA